MNVLGLAAAGALALATSASADYSTDWSGGAGGWIGSGDTATAFTLTAGTWFAPDTAAISSDYLTSPTFVVGDAGSLAFDFTHYYDMENNFDGGVVELSINGGGFNYFAMPDYEPGLMTGNGPLVGLAAYTGSNLTPHLSGTGIAGLTNGDSILFRFHQGDDISTGVDGWYIDDFSLVGASIPGPGGLALLGLAGLAGRRRRR